MKRALSMLTAAALLSGPSLLAQQNAPESEATLRLNSRAVLVDVIVTDPKGNPVKGLTKDAFTVAEQGTPQGINFFEEHRGLSAETRARLQFPQLPPDVFSNYSPINPPPAVNILLIDALNTPMVDQIHLRETAKRYLRTLKPGTRLAIFTLALRLSFVQGFSDDPAVLARALGYRKNDRPEPTPLIQSQAEGQAQDTVIGLMDQLVGAGPSAPTSAGAANMIEAFQQFLKETTYSQTADREYRTTQALQQLGTYLAAFPGRKNLVWLSGAFPLDLFGLTDMRFGETTRKTVNILAAARVAIYPVDVRGAWTHTQYQAENTLSQTISSPQQLLGPAVGFAPSTADSSSVISGQAAVTLPSGGFSQATTSESMSNNSSNAAMSIVAEDTGGRAFYNSNDLAGIIDKVLNSSADFYTIAYTPTDTDMNGGFRKIAIGLNGKDYTLSYRRGYYARDEDRPGAAQNAQTVAVQQAVAAGADPLKPFMDFGLPQVGQILYKERIHLAPAGPAPAASGTPPANGPRDRYLVDFAVDLKDLDLKLDADGLHKGALNLSLIVYDKYGQIASRKDHVVILNIKPDVWSVFEQTGLQLHDDIEVPKGQYWLRTGLQDQSTRKVGTMEVPFSSVHPAQASVQLPATQQP